MATLTAASRLRLADDNVWSELGEEVVILDLVSSSYLGLDNVGAAVWGLLAEPRTVSEIEARLAEVYDADPAALRSDLVLFLGELLDRGLVVVDEEDAAPLP